MYVSDINDEETAYPLVLYHICAFQYALPQQKKKTPLNIYGHVEKHVTWVLLKVGGK